jgi:hypothetical protein
MSNPKFFSGIESSTELSYAYTAENPVMIKNAGLGSSIGSSYYYLSRLRTEKGNKLLLIERFSVKNPKYNKPIIDMPNLHSGKPMLYGNGPLLDLYILIPQNELDTFKIYINPYSKGIVKIPIGLNFKSE